MNAIIKLVDVALIVLLLHAITKGYGATHAPFLPLGLIAAVIYLLLSEITNAHTAYYSASLVREILTTTILWLIVVVGALALVEIEAEVIHSELIALDGGRQHTGHLRDDSDVSDIAPEGPTNVDVLELELEVVIARDRLTWTRLWLDVARGEVSVGGAHRIEVADANAPFHLGTITR